MTIDLHGTDASGAEVVGVDDYLYEVGSGTVVPELDAELHGAKAGAILAFDAPNPNEPDAVRRVPGARQGGQGQEAAGGDRRVGRRELRVRHPGELRADIEDRIGRVKLMQSQMALRQKSIEALSALVSDDDVPEVLVDAEVNERLHDLQHRLEAQKLSLAEYFQATGTSPDELLSTPCGWTHRAAVKADLALRALVEAEELTLSE